MSLEPLECHCALCEMMMQCVGDDATTHEMLYRNHSGELGLGTEMSCVPPPWLDVDTTGLPAVIWLGARLLVQPDVQDGSEQELQQAVVLFITALLAFTDRNLSFKGMYCYKDEEKK